MLILVCLCALMLYVLCILSVMCLLLFHIYLFVYLSFCRGSWYFSPQPYTISPPSVRLVYDSTLTTCTTPALDIASFSVNTPVDCVNPQPLPIKLYTQPWLAAAITISFLPVMGQFVNQDQYIAQY